MTAASTVEGDRNCGPSSILLIPLITACCDKIFLKSTVAQTKMGHENKTTPLLGVLCHPFGQSSFVQSLRALASSIPEIWMAPRKFTTISANADGPRDAV